MPSIQQSSGKDRGDDFGTEEANIVFSAAAAGDNSLVGLFSRSPQFVNIARSPELAELNDPQN